jgi:LysM repeat protein
LTGARSPRVRTARGALQRRRRRLAPAARGHRADHGRLILLALPAALALLGGLALNRSDRVLPGVRVGDVPLGNLPVGTAAVAVSDAWNQRAVSLVAGGQAVRVPMAELGLRVDPSATAWAAHQRGRTLRSWGDLLRLRDPRLVTVVWALDVERAATAIARLGPSLETPPSPDDLRFEGDVVRVVAARDGLAVDPAATLLRLQSDPARVGARGRIEAATRVLPAERRDVTLAAAEANRVLARSVTVRAYDPVRDRSVTLELGPERWRALVRPSVAADGQGVSWTVDMAPDAAPIHLAEADWRHGEFLAPHEVAASVARALGQGAPVAEVPVRHAPLRHTVQPGETVAGIARQHGMPYPYILAANPGLGPDVWPGQDVIVPSVDVFLPLPVVEGKRIVVDLARQELRAWEGGEVRWQWPVSTGIASSPTSPGVFQVQTHEERAYASNWDLWMPDFVGIYRPLPESSFMNGFHGFPTRDGVNLMWTGDLGRPATYGCILVSSDNARLLYEWAEAGVVVEIRDGEG